MFLFVSQIILTLSLGGIILMMLRKIPALLVLTGDTQATHKHRKTLLSRIKCIDLSRHKEMFSKESLKASVAMQCKTTRKEAFDQETDYWDKVTDK